LPLGDAKTYDLLNKANTLVSSSWNPAGCGTCAASFNQFGRAYHGVDRAVPTGSMELIPEFIKRRHVK